MLRIDCTTTSTRDHGILFGSHSNKNRTSIIHKQSTNSILFRSYQDQIDVWRPSHSKCSLHHSMRSIRIASYGSVISPSSLTGSNLYFADRTNASSTPSFIAKLWNLEPFGITGLKWRSDITYFPSRFQRLTIMEAVESLV
ncbi:hypothetical protein KY289_028512 [Solanum tuberosum]|nr:hypothetical protein KY289_028512 [Solanum tuberosum]